MDERDRPDDPNRVAGGRLGGHPVEPDELAPEEVMPDPPEGGNRQPRDEDAIEREPGQDL